MWTFSSRPASQPNQISKPTPGIETPEPTVQLFMPNWRSVLDLNKDINTPTDIDGAGKLSLMLCHMG